MYCSRLTKLSQIKISIVGLSYNGKDIVSEMIKSIYDSSLSKEELEIIIIDNASTDGTPDIIRKNFPAVKVIARNKNIGSGAHNDALKIAKGEYLLFTDSDMKFEKDCLKNFYITANHLGENIILCPTLYEYNNNTKLMPSYSILSRSFYSDFVKTKNAHLKPQEVFMTGFPFIHRNTARKIGYIFDKDYFLYGEDFDLCLRIRLNGFKLYTCPSAIMYNLPPTQTVKKYISQIRITYYLERNLLITFFKICSTKTILLYLPYVFVVRILALLKDLFTLNIKMFQSRIRSYYWVLSHFNLVLRKRKDAQKTRVKSDKEIFSIANDKYFIKSKLGLLK
jgi:GT2 family glycosyltransferase